MTWVARPLRAWPLKKPGPGEGSGVDDGGNGTGLTDDDVICSCLNVTKATVKKVIECEDAIAIPAITNCTRAGTGWGGCCAPVGKVPRGLAAALKAGGKYVAKEFALTSLTLGESPSTSSE